MTTEQLNLDLTGESPNTTCVQVMDLPEGMVVARLFVDADGQFACPDVLNGKFFSGSWPRSSALNTKDSYA